jgi:hypothetical protein
VFIKSTTPGVTVVNASTTVVVFGVTLARSTGDANAGDSPNANKNWVDANIQISPQTANNPVGVNHKLTATVNVNDGTGFTPAPDGTLVTFTIQAGSVGAFNPPGANTCATVGGSCSVFIKSLVPGNTTVSASTTVTVLGVALSRSTGDAHVGDSPNASKNWGDDVVSTKVLNASNADITNTTVSPGTVIHDQATVTKAAGTPASVPAPTGTVTFVLYNTTSCTGTPLSTETDNLVAGVANAAPVTTVSGTFGYLATYNGDPNYPTETGPCEPFTVQSPFTANLTPGFWKNHAAATQALLPQTLGAHVVSKFSEAQQILSGMGCGHDGALNCMAGMELAALLNLAQGGNTCIEPTIAQANALLIKYSYHGFATYSLSGPDQALAMQLHDELSAYNIDGVPTC